MHPVKAEEAIAEAYFTHNVRTFSLDTMEELEKIVRATRGATDLKLLRPDPRLVRPFQAQPRRQVRRRTGRDEGAADGDPPGGGRARHLLPRRQPGDDAGRLCARRWSGCARRSSRRRSPSTSSMSAAAFRRSIPAWSRRRSRPISTSIHERVRGPAGLLFVGTVVRARPGAVRGICEPAGPRREAPRRRALHQRRRLWRAVRCRASRLALPGEADPRAGFRDARTWRSASTGRPATISTIWPGRSMLPADIARRRLCRDRHARRLWLRDAHGVQRLRRGRNEDRRRTSRWRASMSSSRPSPVRTWCRCAAR